MISVVATDDKDDSNRVLETRDKWRHRRNMSFPNNQSRSVFKAQWSEWNGIQVSKKNHVRIIAHTEKGN